MGTGAVFTNLYSKKLLPYDQLRTGFLDYLRDREIDIHSRVFNDDGSFDVLTPVIPTAFVDGVRITAAFAGASGDGYTIEFGAADPLLSNILFENSLGVVYHLGLRHVIVEDGVEVNPRTGWKHYTQYKESIGNLGTPNLVTDMGAFVRVIVNSVTEPGVSHVGRNVKIWLTNPLIDIPAAAFETCAVQWNGFNNFIDTGGLLGQMAGSVSTTPADYKVQELGVTFQRQTSGDLRTTPGVLFLAAITGGGPGTPVLPGQISTVDQHVIAWTASAWSEITRIDIHGDTKVQVTADVLDVNEDQITVLDALAARVFGVDEDGDTYIGGDVDLIGNLVMSSSSEFQFDDYSIYEGAGYMFFEVTGAGPWPAGAPMSFFWGAGTGFTHSVYLDGTLYLAGATAIIDSITYGGADLNFRDPYTFGAGGVNLSGFDVMLPTWGQMSHFTHPSIVESLNEAQDIESNHFACGVNYGIEPSIGIGTSLGFTAGSVLIAKDNGSGLRCIREALLSPISFAFPVPGTYYVYVDDTGALVSTLTYTTAFTDGYVQICSVYSDGANLSGLSDLRFFTSQSDRNVSVTVGPVGFAGPGNPRIYNFQSLKAAVDWVNLATNVWGVVPHRYAPVEIVISGPLVETQTISINTPVTIRSNLKQSNSMVSWSFTGAPLFYIQCSDVTMRDTLFAYGGGAGGTFCALVDVGSGIKRFKFQGNEVQAGFLDYVFTTGGLGMPVSNSRWEGNYIWRSGASGSPNEYVFDFDVVEDIYIQNNLFNGGYSTNCDIINLRGGFTRVTVEDNYFTLARDALVVPFNFLNNQALKFLSNTISVMHDFGFLCWSPSAAMFQVNDNLVMDTGQTNSAGAIYSAAWQSVYDGNICYYNGGGYTTAFDITVNGWECAVTNNISYYGDGGIWVGGGSPQRCVIDGNICVEMFYREGILVEGGYDVISNNLVWGHGAQGGGVGAAGIRALGTGHIITGNHVEGKMMGAGGGTWGIRLQSTYDCVVIGNHVEIWNSDAATSAVGIGLSGWGHVVVGNYLGRIGNNVNGGIGIYASATYTAITGNYFRNILGHAIWSPAGTSGACSITGNVMNGIGQAGIVNPLSGTIQLDIIYVSSNGNVVSSNVTSTLTAGAWGVTFAVGSSNNIGQLNRCVCPGGNVRDLAAANMIGANAVNNNL